MQMPARLRWIDSPLASRIFATALTLLASYLGYEKVEEFRAANQVQDIVVDVQIKPALQPAQRPAHQHGPVLTKPDVTRLIKESIAAQIAAQHKKDLHLFKKKESWDNGG